MLGIEYRRLRLAMRARGFAPKTDRHTLRTFGFLVGMLVVRAAERSERVLDAMRCRGFDGRFHALATTRFALADAVGLALLAAGLGLLVALEMSVAAA